MAIKSLLQLTSTEALVFKDFCGLDEALERMREQLELMDEFQRDYARDVEILRREVEFIFHRKIEMVGGSDLFMARAFFLLSFLPLYINTIFFFFNMAGCAGSNMMWVWTVFSFLRAKRLVCYTCIIFLLGLTEGCFCGWVVSGVVTKLSC